MAAAPVPALTPRRRLRDQRALAASLLAGALSGPAAAAEPQQGIEQALGAAQQSQRGVMLFVQGQSVAGSVLRIEPGAWVELRSAQYGRIVLRLDRIDGLAHP